MEEKGGEEMVSMGASASPASQGSPSQEEGSHEERGVSSEASAEEEQFERTLTAVDGVAVVVGLIIGTGIFASPGVVLGHVQQVGVALLVWFVGGFLSLLGGLCFAELGTAIPSTGGGRCRTVSVPVDVGGAGGQSEYTGPGCSPDGHDLPPSV